MLGKHFRLLFSFSILFFSANIFALTIQSGSSFTYFNTKSETPPPYVPPPPLFGPYVGVNLGYGWQQESASGELYQGGGATDYLYYTPGSLHGLFEQINVGYVFNNYLGVEFGGMHFDDGTYTINSYQFPNKQTLFGSATTTIKTMAADLLLKLSLPIKHTGLSLFAAGGGAYERVSYKSNYSNLPAANVSLDGLITSVRNTGFVVPMLAAGVSYAITQHLSALATYDYLSGKGSICKNYTDYFPSAHMFTLGFQWLF